MLESLLLQERRPASQWVEENLLFPRGTSPNAPGPVSFELTPYLREIVDCASDPEIQDVYFVGGAQVAKTAALVSIFGYFVGQEPADGLWAMKSIDQVRDFSKKRLMDFIKENPPLARRLKVYDPTAFTPLSYELDGMNMRFVGTGSPAQMSSFPCAFVIADEAGKYEWENKEESTPLQLLTERTKAFPRRFHIFASTPTTTESEFWQGFLGTDMRQYFVPCPYCSGEFVLEFSPETVKWDKPENGITDIDLAESTTRYICPHCGRDIYNDQKAGMLAKGHWAPSAALRAEYGDDRLTPSRHARGYHLSSMYSPFVTWGQYTRKFLECLNQLTAATALQNLKNSWAGLPYEFTKVNIKADDVNKLCGDYARGTLPAGVEPYYIAVGYDPGGDETHWVAVAIGTGGEQWVIDWGTILRYKTDTHPINTGTDAAPVWETAIDQPGAAVHFTSLHWGDLRPDMAFMDAGYETKAIYDECLMVPDRRMVPTKGSDARFGTWFERECGPLWPNQLVLTYGDYNAKIELYQRTIDKGQAPLLHLPCKDDVTADLVHGLVGQKLVSKNGKTFWRRVPDDHYGDCIKICRVGWWAMASNYEDTPLVPAPEPTAEEQPPAPAE